MKRLSLALMTTAACMCMSLTSQAAGTMPPMFDWSGPYVGLNAGNAWARVDYGITLTGEKAKTNPEGFVGGGQVGYNFQMNQWVFGPEFSFNYADMIGGKFRSLINPTVAYSSKFRSYAILGGRLGYAVDNVLLYTNVGYALADIKVAGVFTGVDSFSKSKTFGGLAIGAGVDCALTNDMSVGLNFTYADFGSKTLNGLTKTLNLNYTASNVNPRLYAVTARINYHF